MAEYIEREAFKRKLVDEKNFFPAIVARALDEMPAADVVEVKHGEWIVVKEYNDYRMRYEAKIACSVCDHKPKYKGYLSDMDYCPKCGAKMDGGRDETL